MREIHYCFNSLGLYETKDSTFLDQPQLKIMMDPHKFSIAIGGEVLRSSSCKGYQVEVSRKGAVTFYDQESNRIAGTEETDRTFEKVLLSWKQGSVCIEFGKVEEVDYYPNCDGEFDRWGTTWCPERKVTLDEITNALTISP